MHSSSMNKLMEFLNRELVVGPATHPFAAHYIASYGEVPLWVLSNDLTFGNMSGSVAKVGVRPGSEGGGLAAA